MVEIQTWDHYIHQDTSEADLDSETDLSTRERRRLSSVMKRIMGGNLKTRWTTSKMGKDSSDGSFLWLCITYGRIYGKLSWYLIHSKITNDRIDGSCSDL